MRAEPKENMGSEGAILTALEQHNAEHCDLKDDVQKSLCSQMLFLAIT
jgi:hypothetical protein